MESFWENGGKVGEIFTRRAIPNVMTGAEVSVNRIHPSRQLGLTQLEPVEIDESENKTGQSKESSWLGKEKESCYAIYAILCHSMP